MKNLGIRGGLAAILGAGALAIGVGESLAEDPASELRALRNSMNINLRNDPNLRQNMDFHLREYEIQETEERARASAASQTEEIKEEIRRQSEETKEQLRRAEILRQLKEARKAQQEKDVSIFTCNYAIDLDKNGKVAENEILGKGKKSFKKGEVFCVVASLREQKGKTASLQVYGPNGESVYFHRKKLEVDGELYGLLTHGKDNLKDNWVRDFVRKGGVGGYKAVISIDGKVMDSCDFETEGLDEPIRETASPARAKESNPVYNAPKQKDAKRVYETPKPKKSSKPDSLVEMTDEEFAKIRAEMPDIRAAMEKCYNKIAAEATNKNSRNFMIDYGDVQRKYNDFEKIYAKEAATGALTGERLKFAEDMRGCMHSLKERLDKLKTEFDKNSP